MLKKLSLKEDTPSLAKELSAVMVNDKSALEKAADEITFADENVIMLFKVGAECVGAAVTAKDKLFYFDLTGGLLSEIDIADLKPVFESEVPKIMHYSKDDEVYLASYGIKINNIVFDTAIAAYILEPSKSKYNIDTLLNIQLPEEFNPKGKTKKTLFDCTSENIAEIAAKICGGMLSLRDLQLDEIKKREQEKLFFDVEMPLSKTLAEMETAGFKVDRESLAAFSEILDIRISELQNSIYERAGEEFNINSTKQLGVILFDKLNLPVIKKTKTGYSTDSDVLDKLEPENAIITDIKEYRMLTKLKSTYCDGLLQVIDSRDGKIHSKFMQTVTQTGRISSTEPNLQNIPVRLELGREIRKMFVAGSDDNVLVDADYSQIELRVLAHIADDENMIKAFNENEDIHAVTASQVFGVPISEVTPNMRRNAKAVNFGIVYGISDFALGVDLGITKREAKAYIDGYLEKYSGVKKYMKDIVQQASDNGYVTTLFGRRRYIPELKASKFAERSFGQRVAMNTPIQGSAADIIKIAMVKVSRRLKEEGLSAKLILQVHDELIIEAPKNEVQQVKKLLKEEMENAASLKVPLTVSIETGKSWYECK